MTEYEEDYEEDYGDEPGDLELRERVAEVRGMLEQQQDEDRINAEIQRLQAAHGSAFSQEEVQGIGALIDQGYDPREAYEAVDPATEDDHQFEATVEQFERQEGRALSTGEQERVWEAVQHGEEEVQLHNLDSTQGRRQWAAERYSEQFQRQETPEVVEQPADDASADERKAYMTARLEGAEVSDWPYQSPASESGETE